LAKTAEKRVKLKGNIVAIGTSTTGTRGNPSDLYAAFVKQAIQEHFEVYPWQLRKGLEATVSLRIKPTGRVEKKTLKKSSGERTFDLGLLKAIEKAEPFRVPEDIGILEQELVITFRPEDKK